MDFGYNPRTSPWHIDPDEFYEQETYEGQVRFLLRYAILAPSGHNTQPWSFRILSDGVSILADYDRRLSVADPADRELLMSIGAAIMNLRVAAAHFGMHCKVSLAGGEAPAAHLATLRIRESFDTERELAPLFSALPRRRTNRSRYRAKPLAAAELARILSFSGESGRVLLITGEELKEKIARMVNQGDRWQLSDPDFREELSHWMWAPAERKEDGLSTDSFGIPGLVSRASLWMMKRLNLGQLVGARDAAAVREAGAIAIVTGENRREDLIEAGQALEKLLLVITALGLQYSFFNQPIAVAPLRRRLRQMAGIETWPQVMIRIGYGPEVKKAAPRRKLESVLRS